MIFLRMFQPSQEPKVKNRKRDNESHDSHETKNIVIFVIVEIF